MNAQWLGDILLGNFEALRQIHYGRYTAFNLQEPFAPTQHLVFSLLGEWSFLCCPIYRCEASTCSRHLYLPEAQPWR